jgi:TolA-binding protein
MNKMVSVKALLTVLLVFGFIASSALALTCYQRATANELRAEALATSLNDVKIQLKKSQSQLNDAVGQLKQTTGRLSQAQAESQRRLSLIFAQEDNVNVLKSCLTGVAADDVFIRKGTAAFSDWVDSRSDDDYETALDNFKMGTAALDSVSADCSKASDLIQ